MAENEQAAAGNENQNQPQFALQRIYVKDLSFESPNSPTVFQDQWKPQVNLDLNTSHNKISDNQRRRQPLYSKLPKRLRTSDLDDEGRCEEAGIIVKSSPGKGFGAFAAKAFDEDITIADYVGEQLTQAEVDVRYKKSKMDWKDKLWRKSRQLKGITVSGDYIFRVEDDLYVDAEDPAFANWCRFINHSSDANLRVKSLAYSGYTQGPRVWFVSTRPIKEGEELCFDYGEEYWFEEDKPVA